MSDASTAAHKLWPVLWGYVLVAGVMQWQWTWFCYDRHVLLSQFWRVWTGHWVHLNWTHYALNVAALLCLPWVLAHSQRQDVLRLLLLLPLAISALLYWYQPQLMYYAGLSGVLHGLYMACALRQIVLGQERWIAIGVLVIIAIKLGYEQWHGDSQTAVLIGYPVVIDAHLYGSLLACAYMATSIIVSHFKQS